MTTANDEPGDGTLTAAGLHAGYGRARVLFGVSITVAPGEIVALLGANGVGKTTLLRALSGLVKVVSGEVRLGTRDITNMAAERIAASGMAHVPQGRGLFRSLSVEDNIRVGGYTMPRRGVEERVTELIETMFPQLAGRRKQAAGHLSGGEQQMVALMRGLMTSPRLLLLDEPTLGLAPVMRNSVLNVVRAARDAGTGVLVVEQNARHVLSVSDRCCVMRAGRIVYEAPAAEALDAYDTLSDQYLGTGVATR